MNIFKKVPITNEKTLENKLVTATERWVHVISIDTVDSGVCILDSGEFYITKSDEDLRVCACCQEIVGVEEGLGNITHTYCPECVKKHFK